MLLAVENIMAGHTIHALASMLIAGGAAALSIILMRQIHIVP